jgi:hypothetical protein
MAREGQYHCRRTGAARCPSRAGDWLSFSRSPMYKTRRTSVSVNGDLCPRPNSEFVERDRKHSITLTQGRALALPNGNRSGR